MDVFETTTALGTAVLVFLIVLAILWFLLPFAVFGVKPLLAEILLELQLLRAQYSSSPPGNPSGSNVTDDPKPSGDHVDTSDESEPSGLAEAFPTFSKVLHRRKP